MKHKSFIKFTHSILSAFLVLLGFSACNSNEEQMPLMYGTKETEYEIKGKVVQKEDKEKPVEGIQVVSYPINELGNVYPDTLFTGSDGIFVVERIYDLRYMVILEDVDGEKNGGVFKKETITIDRSKIKEVYISEKDKYQYQVTFELEKEEDPEPLPEPEP